MTTFSRIIEGIDFANLETALATRTVKELRTLAGSLYVSPIPKRKADLVACIAELLAPPGYEVFLENGAWGWRLPSGDESDLWFDIRRDCVEDARRHAASGHAANTTPVAIQHGPRTLTKAVLTRALQRLTVAQRRELVERYDIAAKRSWSKRQVASAISKAIVAAQDGVPAELDEKLASPKPRAKGPARARVAWPKHGAPITLGQLHAWVMLSADKVFGSQATARMRDFRHLANNDVQLPRLDRVTAEDLASIGPLKGFRGQVIGGSAVKRGLIVAYVAYCAAHDGSAEAVA